MGKFKKFEKMVTTQKGVKIKRFRSDNGGEYGSNSFNEMLVEKGIIAEKTMPYTPELNGVAERMNRTLLERTLCIMKLAIFLNDSGVKHYRLRPT